MHDRIIAIPDIHGRLDLLEGVIDLVAPMKAEIVFLGDYIDRGPDSKEVIERLREFVTANVNVHAIMGNHEWTLVAALRNWTRLRIESWIRWGGDATLQSYGVDPSQFSNSDHDKLAHVLAKAVPTTHKRWLYELPICADFEKHIFVHGGLDHERSLYQQDGDACMWRRTRDDPDHDFGKHVVVGHTVYPEPRLRQFSTALDCEAFKTGRLHIGVFDRVAGGGPLEVLTVERPPMEYEYFTPHP